MNFSIEPLFQKLFIFAFMKNIKYLLYLLPILLGLACKSKDNVYPPGYEKGDEYFSMHQYFDDQWKNRNEMPYVFAKVTEINGKVTDSQIVDWGEPFFKEIRAQFEKAEIGKPKYLGQYHFTEMEEYQHITWLYEAANPDLETKKIILRLDPENYKVKTVYAEIEEDGIFSFEKTNMTYIPDGPIKIVTFKKPMFGDKQEIVISYKFL